MRRVIAVHDTPKEEGIGCRDSCGARVPDETAAMQAGWSYLHVTGGWRCGPCAAALRVAAGIPGPAGAPMVDPLPPNSRGALPKETASTISAPVVNKNPGGEG